MTITFACPSCRARNTVALSLAGRDIPCQGCGGRLVVPVPREPAGGAPPAREPKRIKFACKCGHREAVGREWAGRKFLCPGCGKALRIPDRGRPESASALSSTPPSSPPGAESCGRVPSRAEARPRARAVAGEAGQGGRRGVEEEELVEPLLLPARGALRPVGGDAPPAEEAPKPKKKKRRKRKKGASVGLEGGEALGMIGVVFLIVLVVAGAGALLPGLRYGTSVLLLVVGFIFAFVGNIGFGNVANQEGAMYGMLCKMVPLYKWYYLYTRWNLMKEHILFYAVGLMMIYPGLALWELAPSLVQDEDGKGAQAAKAAPGRAKAGAPVAAPERDEDEEGDAPVPPTAVAPGAPPEAAAPGQPAPSRRARRDED